MQERFKPKTGAVQETLMIPLFGRAVETNKPNGLLRDPKAVEIVETLDYDFSKWKKAWSLAGCCVRTIIYDRMPREFLNDHPGERS